MKPLFAAAALSLLAVTAAHASGNAGTAGTTLRSVELTNAREIHDAGSTSITVTVGSPKEVSVAVLPPRDRVEAGYRAKDNATVTVLPLSTMPQSNRR